MYTDDHDLTRLMGPTTCIVSGEVMRALCLALSLCLSFADWSKLRVGTVECCSPALDR
jgi:hypothetical protein